MSFSFFYFISEIQSFHLFFAFFFLLVFSLVDSHAHLSMKDFNEDRDAVIQTAFKEGIKAILCPIEITDSHSLHTTIKLIDKYKNIAAAGGTHPHNAKNFNPMYIDKIIELAKQKKIHAIGEIGLDFHYNFSPVKDQKEVLRQQLHTAQKLNLPVIIHSRNARKSIIQAVKEEHFTAGGVLHCFTENWEFANQMMDQNFLISFSGILTFPKAHPLREVAKKIPLERLLVETDSPYLVPIPYRGRIKRNEPIYVKAVAECLSVLKNISLKELEESTTQNFESLFQFEIKKRG